MTGTGAGAGAVNRVIDIECRAQEAVITDGMRISNALKRNFGFAGREFVDHLYRDDAMERVAAEYQTLFRSLSCNDTTEKQAMAAAVIVEADRLANEWVFGGRADPITPEEISAFLASKAAVSAGIEPIITYVIGLCKTQISYAGTQICWRCLVRWSLDGLISSGRCSIAW